jgi:hypothetical protein
MAKSVYLATVIATIAIILIILFSIKLADDSKISSINEQVKQISLESELQGAYADFDVNNSAVYCTVIDQGIKSGSKRLSELDQQLKTFKDNSFNSGEFYSAKRSYLLASMVLFRSLQKAKEHCDLNTKTVLFFYAEDKSCEVECGVLGSQLNELRKTCSTFRDFHFPYNWPTYDFTRILEVKYGINKPGTLVIDGNVIESVQPKEVLAKELGCA